MLRYRNINSYYMAGRRSINNKRRRRHIYKRKTRKSRRRNQKGGLPLPLLALGAGFFTPMIADGVRSLMNRLNI